MILTAFGWMAAVTLLAIAASCAWHARQDKTWGPLAGSGLYAGAAVTLLADTGALKGSAAAVLALGCFAASAAVAAREGGWKGMPGMMLGYARYGLRAFGMDAASLGQRGTFSPVPGGKPAGGSPEAAVAEAAAAGRAIPSVMDDPFLGPPPEPAELATAAVPVPAAWAALAAYIGSREPADDMELRMFSDGDTAGALAVADAYHAYADTCLNGLGLSPAYVAGILEAGDSAAGHASVIAQVHKRFAVIYGAVKEWIGAHGPLPHKARDFLTGL